MASNTSGSTLTNVDKVGAIDAGAVPLSSADEKKQHRKLQNRRNQRAHRLRLLEQRAAAQAHDPGYRPYHVHRWRLESEPQTLGHDLSSSRELVTLTVASRSPEESSQFGWMFWVSSSHAELLDAHSLATAIREAEFPLPADHLLHLVQFNVLRALSVNKTILKALSMYSELYDPHPRPCASGDDCMIRGTTAKKQTMRPHETLSITPTRLQMSWQHSPWIGMIPWPRVRDNLIELQWQFDHREFLEDLVGHVPENIPLRTQKNGSFSCSAGAIGSDDEVTSGRQGLIVWGEPHDVGSWEATPGFLSKWAWTIEGCVEVIDNSNRWRALRGEEPLRLPVAM